MADLEVAPIAAEEEASAADAFFGFLLLGGMGYGIYRGVRYLRRRGETPTGP